MTLRRGGPIINWRINRVENRVGYSQDSSQRYSRAALRLGDKCLYLKGVGSVKVFCRAPPGTRRVPRSSRGEES